jgi:hypothetical protein
MNAGLDQLHAFLTTALDRNKFLVFILRILLAGRDMSLPMA